MPEIKRDIDGRVGTPSPWEWVREKAAADPSFDALGAIAESIPVTRLIMGMDDFLVVRHPLHATKEETPSKFVRTISDTTRLDIPHDDIDGTSPALLAVLDQHFAPEYLRVKRVKGQDILKEKVQNATNFLAVSEIVRRRMAATTFVDVFLEGVSEAPDVDAFTVCANQLMSPSNLVRLFEWGGTFNLVSKPIGGGQTALDRQFTRRALRYAASHEADASQAAATVAAGLNNYRSVPKRKDMNLAGARDELNQALPNRPYFVVNALARARKEKTNPLHPHVGKVVLDGKQQFASLVLQQVENYDIQTKEAIIVDHLNELRLNEEELVILLSLEQELLDDMPTWDRTTNDVGPMAYRAVNLMAQVLTQAARYIEDPRLTRFVALIDDDRILDNLDAIVEIGNNLGSGSGLMAASSNQAPSKLEGKKDLPRALDRIFYRIRRELAGSSEEKVKPVEDSLEKTKSDQSKDVSGKKIVEIFPRTKLAKANKAHLETLGAAARVAVLLAHAGIDPDPRLGSPRYSLGDWIIRYPDALPERIREYMKIDDGSPAARIKIHSLYISDRDNRPALSLVQYRSITVY